MTNKTVVTRIRGALSDTIETYRWSGPVLLDHVTTAIRQVVADRPDARYDDDGEIVSASLSATDESHDFPLADKWSDHVATLAAALALEMDAADTTNQALAVYLRDQYTRLVRK